MKEQQDSLLSHEWLKIARKDWARIQYMLENVDAEAAGFFLQQSLEKYLKAFLLQHGWSLRKIHELDALLDDAVKYNSELKNFYNLCECVSNYYFTERYPPLGLETAELTCENIRKDLEEAKKFVQIMFPEEELNI